MCSGDFTLSRAPLCDCHSRPCKLNIGRILGAAANRNFLDLLKLVDVLSRVNFAYDVGLLDGCDQGERAVTTDASLILVVLLLLLLKCQGGLLVVRHTLAKLMLAVHRMDLFCNIFKIRRRLDLFDVVHLTQVRASSGPITLTVVISFNRDPIIMLSLRGVHATKLWKVNQKNGGSLPVPFPFPGRQEFHGLEMQPVLYCGLSCCGNQFLHFPFPSGADHLRAKSPCSLQV